MEIRGSGRADADTVWYDAFGNRTFKEEESGRTLYRHNVLNQLITEFREGGSAETVLRKAYQYDKRGNLTRITENGQMTQQYVYGALNRLEEAVNGAGKAAKYQYNGLGHRVGKLEGTLSKGKLEGLDPRNGIKAGTEIGNWNQIRYTIDLTREYHNLLEKTKERKGRRTSGMGTWHPMKRMEDRAITCRMSWEAQSESRMRREK